MQLIFRHYDGGQDADDYGTGGGCDNRCATATAIGEVPVGTPQYSSAEIEATASAVQPGTRDPVGDSYLWIMGAGETGWDSSSETTQIVADKKSYAPGDTAHLSIVSETDGFYALVNRRRATLCRGAR